MEDHDYKFDSFKLIDYEEHPEIIEKIRKLYRDSGIIELLKELDHMENEPNINERVQETRLKTIKRLIAIKLDLVDNDHADYMIDTLPGYIEHNEKEIKKLEKKYLKHRHDKDKAFSSVPTE